MSIHQKILMLKQVPALRWMALLVSVMAYRFIYIFTNPPTNHLFSDPHRHWDNARNFWTPGLFGSMDPLMYQLFLWFVRTLTQDNSWAIAACVGVLSAALPWFWFKALKEVVPVKWALAGGALIGLMPSTTLIYSYFMQETLMLTLIGAAVWLSMRALRLGSLGAYAWAVVIWALACYTRIIALPLAFGFISVMCVVHLRQLPARAAIVALAFGTLALPACMHSYMKLNYCEPFGSAYPHTIYRISQNASFKITIHGVGEWFFGSPAYVNRPFLPFSDWKAPREGVAQMVIDLTKGEADWKRELDAVNASPKPMSPLQDWRENLAFLFFDPSWPDNNMDYRLGALTIHSRWLVLPMTLFVLLMTCKYLHIRNWRMLLIPLAALGVMSVLLIQQRFIIEGRYRKVAEPMLMAACVVLAHRTRREKLSKNLH